MFPESVDRDSKLKDKVFVPMSDHPSLNFQIFIKPKHPKLASEPVLARPGPGRGEGSRGWKLWINVSCVHCGQIWGCCAGKLLHNITTTQSKSWPGSQWCVWNGELTARTHFIAAEFISLNIIQHTAPGQSANVLLVTGYYFGEIFSYWRESMRNISRYKIWF